MKFSERKGLVPARTKILRDEVSPELRNTLWSVLLTLKFTDNFCPKTSNYFEDIDSRLLGIGEFSWSLWFNLFHKPVDERPRHAPNTFEAIRKYYFESNWHELYDFMEFCLNYYGQDDELVKIVNGHLESHLAPYRFVGQQFTEITDTQEIEMLEEALSNDQFPHAKAHLTRALELLSDRSQPDYRNSIKESISAVESIAKQIACKPSAELGEALKTIEKNGKLHGAMKQAFLSLYGYTSDANGIRHALMDEPNLTADDAKFFLMSCTSFINYLKTKV